MLEGLGLATAFAGGAVSFLSPCVLPIVPGYISYVAGGAVAPGQALPAAQRGKALALSALFVTGFSAVFISFGASASALGQLLLRHRYEANLVAGVIVVAFGLLMLGMTRWLPGLQRDFRLQPRVQAGGPLAALVLGAAFGFGWTPCIGPILGAILAIAAVKTSGIGLLTAYALGLGVPFLLTALFVDRASRLLARLRSFGAAMQFAGGAILVVLGAAMITGQMTAFSLWLLEAFPALGQIG